MDLEQVANNHGFSHFEKRGAAREKERDATRSERRAIQVRSDRLGNFIVFLRNYIRARALRSGTRDEDSRLERTPRYVRAFVRSRCSNAAAQQRDETLTMRNNTITRIVDSRDCRGYSRSRPLSSVENLAGLGSPKKEARAGARVRPRSQADLRGVYTYLYFERLVHTEMIYDSH